MSPPRKRSRGKVMAAKVSQKGKLEKLSSSGDATDGPVPTTP